MPWTCVQREVLGYGKEKFLSSTLGVDQGIATHRGNQPGVCLDRFGRVVAAYTRGTSHQARGSVSVFRRSSESGRYWGSASDEILIYSAGYPLRTTIQGLKCTKHGARPGRLIISGFVESLDVPEGGIETSTAYVSFSDDDGDTWTFRNLPSLDDKTLGCGIEELPNGRVLVAVYTRRAGEPGCRSFIVASDDPDLVDASWSVIGTIASDPAYTTEYKEPCIARLQDGRLIACIRSDDSIQVTRTAFSSDGGVTWSDPTIAFQSWNYPTVIQLADGTIVSCSRHHTGVPSDGNDCSAAFFSYDNGATWGDETALYDPALGTGASAGCTPVELPDGRLGIIHGWAPPSAIFNRTRLEFTVWTRTPSSSGSYARYTIDENRVHPSKYASNVTAWYSSEHLRQANLVDGDTISRWVNGMGVPAWDLVPGPSGALLFGDGSDMLSPPGLLGGLGIATNHAGNKAFATASAVTLAQPFAAIFVGDATTPISTLILWDDGAGASAQFQASGGGLFFLRIGGVNRFFTPSGFPPGPIVLTTIFDGASSSVRSNGVALSVASGSALGTTAIQGFRPNGASNSGFWHGLREMVVLQSNDLAAIAALETALMTKHRLI